VKMTIYNFLCIVSIPMDVVVALSTAFAFAIDDQVLGSHVLTHDPLFKTSDVVCCPAGASVIMCEGWKVRSR
jgi:hypothetical protein